eukprot:TRINITY_DN7349_c0_g1_i14.p1 TRINITY_DN7349_c0_g1~~TRINITY_DN7349_c0_g1_i14.p1  ORF type:complete len:108 (+),score=15.68 TRINITY_DN7349_c0_g1_i14:103-426(+)
MLYTWTLFLVAQLHVDRPLFLEEFLELAHVQHAVLILVKLLKPGTEAHVRYQAKCVEHHSAMVSSPIPRFAQYLSLIHISEPTRLLSISYAVFCLKKKKKQYQKRIL